MVCSRSSKEVNSFNLSHRPKQCCLQSIHAVFQLNQTEQMILCLKSQFAKSFLFSEVFFFSFFLLISFFPQLIILWLNKPKPNLHNDIFNDGQRLIIYSRARVMLI